MSIGFLASIKAGINTLTGRLTSTRAGYLDTLQYYTQTRAGYLDTVNTNLNATVSSRLGSIKAIYRGTISVVGITSGAVASNTATITAVDTSKALIYFLGVDTSSAATAPGTMHARIELTNSTTVTAYVLNALGSTETAQVGYQVVEFN